MATSSWWTDQVLPRLVDVALSGPDSDRWRAPVAGAAYGTVLELGFGAGNNLPHYPDEVRSVRAVEPADVAWARARDRIEAFERAGRTVTRVGLDGAQLSAPDHSVDAVVSTWTLCTIPDVESALAEVRRVLRPGGRFHIVEHGLSPDERIARLQRRIQPWWGPLGGGCHVDRDIPNLLRDAGFDDAALVGRYALPNRISRPWSWFVTGSVEPA